MTRSYVGETTAIAAKAKKTYYDFKYRNTGLPVYTRSRTLESNTAGEVYIDKYDYFDGLGRNIQTITFGEDGKSVVSQNHYDNMGRVDRTDGPFFSTDIGWPIAPPADRPYTQTTYNYHGKPTRITIPAPNGGSGTVSSLMEYAGLSTTVTDPDGKAKTEKKDYLGRVIEVTEYAAADYQQPYYTNYTYNAAGDLLAVTSTGAHTQMTYDTLGRKKTMLDADMGSWKYCYDKNGNLIKQIDAKKQIVTFSYDALNRVLDKTYSSTTNPIFSDYDNCTVANETLNPLENPVSYTYDNLAISNGKGRLYMVTNTNVTTKYNAYDSMGRVKSSRKTIAGDPAGYTTSTTYDFSGKPTVTTYPDGYKVTNDYHRYQWNGSTYSTELLYTVTGSDRIVYATNTLYEPTGKIGQIDHPNGTQTRYSYSPKSTKLLGIVTTSPASTGNPKNDVINRSYKYSKAGDISVITDYKKGAALGRADNIFTYNYNYDMLHRFTNETTTNNVYDPVSYTYNKIGNIMFKTVGTTTLEYTYDTLSKPHAVRNITINNSMYNYDYDANGNMIAGSDLTDLTDLSNIASRQITYNTDNMPTEVAHSKYGTTYLSYDASSARAKKISPSGTTYYIGEHFEKKINDDTVKYIFAGNLRIAKVSSADGTFYFHKDHLGSSSAMTNELGNVVETTNYMPFGEQRVHTGTAVSNYKFTDQELDPETGLYYYGARYYDPVIGRFISADSIIPDPFDPQTLNRYTYCRNNPLSYTDPNGHFFLIPLVAAWIGMCVAYGSGGDADAVWKAGATGFVAGYVGGFVGGMVGGGIAGAMIGGAAGGATYAALNGGNMVEGALYGAIGGAVAGGLGELGIPNNAWGITVKIAAAGVTSGIMAELSGAKFSQGALPAMLGATFSSTLEAAVGKSQGNNGVKLGPEQNREQSRYAVKVVYNPDKDMFDRVKDFVSITYKAANIIKGIIQMNSLYNDVVRAAFQLDCDVIVPADIIVHQYSYNPPTYNYIRLIVGPSISIFEPSYTPVRVGIIGARGCVYDDNFYWRQGTSL